MKSFILFAASAVVLSTAVTATVVFADPTPTTVKTKVFLYVPSDETMSSPVFGFFVQGTSIQVMDCGPYQSATPPPSSPDSTVQSFVSDHCKQVQITPAPQIYFETTANRFIFTFSGTVASMGSSPDDNNIIIVTDAISISLNDPSTVSILFTYIMYPGTQNPTSQSARYTLLKAAETVIDYAPITVKPDKILP